MKRLFLMTAVCIINLASLIEGAYGLPWPPEIDVYYIKFNYQSGYSYDALTLKKNNSTYIQVPEWLSGSRNEKIGYIESQSNRRIKVKFWVDRQGFDSMLIYAEKVGQGDGIGDVIEKEVMFDGSQYSSPAVMRCDGSVPGSVGIRSFSWRWYVLEIDGQLFQGSPLWIGDTGPHEYYTVLAAPQNPMSEPWTQVLDYACDWASGTTSEYSALRRVTQHAYYDLNKSYDGSRTHTNGTSFNLTAFFNDNWADCQDMSAVIHVFTRAIGGDETEVRKIWGQFYTKKIDPIGNGEDWQIMLWNFHQVGWNLNVYDACVRLDPDNPRIPVNEDINESYKSDLFDHGYWNPDTPFNYTNVY